MCVFYHVHKQQWVLVSDNGHSTCLLMGLSTCLSSGHLTSLFTIAVFLWDFSIVDSFKHIFEISTPDIVHQ